MGAERHVAASATSPRPGLWNLCDVALYLQISQRQVRREVAARRLRCVRIGRRLLFDPADVSRFVAARKE
jgi:excisionase family DNA binding protein